MKVRKKVFMKKKNYTLASVTIVGLAIATSGGVAFADETQGNTSSSATTTQTQPTAPASASATASEKE